MKKYFISCQAALDSKLLLQVKLFPLFKKIMHSSRMRTGRSLTVCWRLLPGGGGVPSPGGVCSGGGGGVPGLGGVCSGGVSAPRGVVCLVRGGVCSGGVCLVWGVSAPRGGGVPGQEGVVCMVGGGLASQHALRQTPCPPTVDRITDACKTLPWPNFVAAGKNTWILSPFCRNSEFK